ncbi:MAG: VWA domain-containing protein [Terriglobales bacterium]
MAISPALFRAAILPFGLALFFAGPLLAQQNSQTSGNSQSPAPQESSPQFEENSPQFVFRQNVNRVVVDVVVTDSNRKPVRGLTMRDFSIYEDGKPQDILTFDVYSLDSNPSYFEKLPPMPRNTFVNIATAPERGPLYVLLLDLVNTAQDDQPYARQQLLKFINSKPEGTRFAVFVLSDSLHLAQGFTADRSQLYAALDPSHPRSHVPRIFLFGANYGRGDVGLMVSAFRQIALYLDGLPGRKNIIWVSGAFPLDLFPHADDSPDMRAEVTETLDAITRSESAIYPVDVTGVMAFPPGRLTGAVPNGAPASSAPGAPVTNEPIGGPLAGQMAVASTATSPTDSYTVQDAVANLTGGRAFYSRNDLKDVLEQATEAGSDYYTLTYSPSNQNFDGKLRNIRVQLGNNGYHLDYRRGYLATAPQSPMVPPRYNPRKHEDTANLRPIGDSLSAYMQRGAPIARQVYFRAHVHALSPPQLATPAQMANLVDQPTYFRERQKKHPNKPLAPIKLQPYLIEYQVIARVPNLEVAAGVYDDEDRLLNGDVEEATSASPTSSDPPAKFSYFRVRQKIDVPVTAVSLRLGVRDASTDRMGTMEIPLPLAREP